MENPWIKELEDQLLHVPIINSSRARKVMWEKYMVGDTIEGGDILEFGVASGGSIGWFTTHYKDIKVFGFDSFHGLPEDWDLGDRVLQKGTFSTDGTPPLIEGVTYVKGLFEDTFPEWFKEYNSYAKIVHVDCDLYSASKLVFEYIKPHLKVGTWILFDELTHMADHPQYIHNRQHEYKAFKEFLEENPTFEYDVVARTNICQVAIKVTNL